MWWRLRTAVAGVICTGFLASPGIAQTPARSNWTTTLEISACADAADQPVCILRALANFPTHSPYATDWRLAGADAVLRDLGEAGTGNPDGQYEHIPYASTRMAYGHLDANDAAVAAAIVADRRGATPEQALRLVQGNIGVSGAGNVSAYCMRLSDIWKAYGRPEERAARPNTPRPSLALARAALIACDEANAPADAVHPMSLAEAYVAFGDVEAARRVMRRDTRLPAFVRVQTAAITRDWETLTELVEVPARSFEERWRSGYERLRSEALTQVAGAGRADLAARIARAVLEDFLTDPTQQGRSALNRSLDVLIESGTREEADGYIDRLDHMSRDTMQVRSFSAAAAAVHGRVALGDVAGARAIADAWAPRVQWQYDNNDGGCGGERPFCASYGVMGMYLELGAFEEGRRVVHRGSGGTFLTMDLMAGRRLRYLDNHLANAPNEASRDSMLLTCTDYGRRTLEQLADGQECAERLLQRASPNLGLMDVASLRQRRSAATGALNVSERAARLGQPQVMEAMFAALQDAPLTPGERASFREIAIYQLEIAGRL